MTYSFDTTLDIPNMAPDVAVKVQMRVRNAGVRANRIGPGYGPELEIDAVSITDAEFTNDTMLNVTELTSQQVDKLIDKALESYDPEDLWDGDI